MNEPSFKQYLESKKKLIEALGDTPRNTVNYNVKKYCRLRLVESGIAMCRPSTKISVKWLYEDVNNPSVVRVKVDGKEVKSSLNSKKLTRWLVRNTEEMENS